MSTQPSTHRPQAALEVDMSINVN